MLHSSTIQDVLHKVLAESENTDPLPELKPQISTQRDTITVMKVLDKNRGFMLKIHSTGKEITRKLSDIYWLQTTLMTEFPFYYVKLEDSTC